MKLGDKLDNWRYGREDFNSIMQREIDPFSIVFLSFFIMFCLLNAATSTFGLGWLLMAVYLEGCLMFFYEPVAARLEAIRAFDSIEEIKAITVKEELEW